MEEDGGVHDAGALIEPFLEDTLGCCSIQSPLPEIARHQECCMGIDEAGRGPVLGPMVYGTAFCPITMMEKVKDLGVADSKVLSEEKRDELFASISSSSEWLGWKVEVLSPCYISNSMLQRDKYNLNSISHDTAIGLIRKVLSDGVNLKEVYVDTVGDPGKYQDLLQRLFPQLTITVAKKADALFPVVSAASICAKVIRDACLKKWKFVEHFSDEEQESRLKFGSGYTSDPNTKAWLRASLDQVFGYPTVVRFSWSTCRDLLMEKAVDVKWPDDDETEASLGCAKISSFFVKANHKLGQQGRHRYFEERALKNITEL